MRLPVLGTVAATLIMAACGGPPAPEAPAPDEAPAGLFPDELYAHFIGPESGGFTFRLNRPAYVALFEVVADRGIALVHPSHEVQARKQPAGTRWLRTRSTSVNKQRDWYFAESPGMSNQDTPNILRSQRMLFLVASDDPMNLSEISAAGGIRNAIENPAARDPYRAMEQLVEVILPEHSPGGWAMDSWADDMPGMSGAGD